MSGGGHGFRVSTIPSNVKKMIQNIKETGCNHSDEEIYAMLKECDMDPNETVQKLLLQDTFHEVKTKRYKKRENLSSREIVDTRWRSGPPGRFGRGGQGNVSSHHPADAGGGKHSVSAAENGIKQASESAVSKSSAPAPKEVKIKETASASITIAKHTEISSDEQSLIGAPENLVVASGAGTINQHVQPQPSSSKIVAPSAWTSCGHRSASDPVLVRSKDSKPPGAIGANKHELGTQRSRVEPNSNASAESKLNAAHETRSSTSQTKISSKSHGAGKNQLAEFARPSSSSGHSGSSTSRPSSNYGNRSQQVIGPPKGLNKEWKPKPTNTSHVLVSRTSATPEHFSVAPEQSFAAPEQSSAAPEQSSSAPDQSSAAAAKTGVQYLAVNEDVSGSEEPASVVEKELDGLHIKEAQHVIIPNHIHVPDAVRTSLTFGSFEVAAVIGTSKCSEHTSESFQVEDSAVEQDVSNDNTLAPSEEEVSVNHPQSAHAPENAASIDAGVPSSSVSDIDSLKETSGFPQHPVVQTPPAYSYPVVSVPEITEPFDTPDTQAQDASRAPNFVIQQQMDPATANFYAQFYRPAEVDGRISPFHPQGVSTKHIGNAAFLSAQTSESTPEGGNPMAMSTTGQTPLANQPGLMPGTISMTQQAVPVFRQPPGLPMPHYPPNYIPYGHYFSPYYVPPPAIHQFLGNNAFLQQAQAGSVYPGPPTGATAAGVKYPLAQFKPGNNSGNVGVNANYGPYGTSPAGYNTGSAAGNSTANEDLGGTQYKENNVYNGAQQQTEGSTVWITTPGRDISGLQANSYYNLPPQGQHMAFPPPQAGGHGSFPGMYHHPGQPVTPGNVHPLLQQSQAMPGAVDMVGAAPGSVYQQQPQHASQMNWPNNY
ncbi:hypothetical protein V2J09_002674 [Rumex salicifolius]